MRDIVITGGSSGIGAAIAARFSIAGDAATIIGRDPERVQGVADRLGARGEVCDVTDPAALESLVARLSRGVDVLIAMAGGVPPVDDDSTTTGLAAVDAEWTTSLRANTVGTALTVEAFLPTMRSGGSIITVSSIGAEYASGPYGASKAAVAAWMAGLSAAVGPRGITANAISPGYIEDTAFFGDAMTAERRERLIESTHTKRAGTPADIAGVAFFLAGPDARQVTGQTIHVNGGAHTTR